MTDFADIVMFLGGVEVLTCLLMFFGFLVIILLCGLFFASTTCSGRLVFGYPI